MSWDLTGNAGTNPATNFLGTTDGQPLVIKTNQAEALRITPDGQAWLKGSLRTELGHVVTNNPNGALVLNAGPPDATNLAGIWFRQTHVLGDITTYTELMTITADGNVGIGTVLPDAKLTVTGQIHSTTGGIKFPDGSIQTKAALKGDKGEKGDPGPPGPAVHTSAVCVSATSSSAGYCSCSGGHQISIVASPCTLTSETGSCQASSATDSAEFEVKGSCCLCAP